MCTHICMHANLHTIYQLWNGAASMRVGVGKIVWTSLGGSTSFGPWLGGVNIFSHLTELLVGHSIS